MEVWKVDVRAMCDVITRGEGKLEQSVIQDLVLHFSSEVGGVWHSEIKRYLSAQMFRVHADENSTLSVIVL